MKSAHTRTHFSHLWKFFSKVIISIQDLQYNEKKSMKEGLTKAVCVGSEGKRVHGV